MDHHIAAAQLLAALIAQPEAVAAEVDLDHGKLGARQLREGFVAELLLQPLESRAGKHLALKALRCGTPRARTNREVDPSDLGYRAEALLDDRLAEEAGAAGDQDGLALQGIGDHRPDSRGRPKALDGSSAPMRPTPPEGGPEKVMRCSLTHLRMRSLRCSSPTGVPARSAGGIPGSPNLSPSVFGLPLSSERSVTGSGNSEYV